MTDDRVHDDDLAPLDGACVVLGVCGGIAAYKAVEVLRRLIDQGAHVVPILTASAARFVGAPTFSALASEPAETELFGAPHPVPHVRLGRAADVVVVVPATARLIGAYASGISSDLLTATLLATKAPVLICPAMHAEMWEHPAVRENVTTLERRGVVVLPPVHGRLAGGDVGIGRLAEPEDVLAAVARMLAAARPTRAGGGLAGLAGLRVLVTAGGTREPIDPVRYLANRSSGRQGHALAAVAAASGARVVLVTASALPTPPSVTTVRVDTAAELADAVLSRTGEADVVVMAAAVADFRPMSPAPEKLHKRDGLPRLELEATEDVLVEIGRRRRAGDAPAGQVIIGFAAETGDVIERARTKLAEKGLDVVVANDVTAPGVGFGHETNAVTLVYASGEVVQVPLSPKPTIAHAVLEAALLVRSGARAVGSVSTTGRAGADASHPRVSGRDQGADR